MDNGRSKDNGNVDDTISMFSGAGGRPSGSGVPIPGVDANDPAYNLGAVMPGWSVVEKIGEGSFGKVYKASREGHGFTDYAAIKVITIPQSPAELSSLRADGYDETSARSYFESIVTDVVSEIKLMVSMKGTTNIVSIEDYYVVEKSGEIGWDIFIRMELLQSFTDYITGRNLSEPEVIKLGQDICSALELCAQKNIIHRDIKPENIFISSFGSFKLGDFGIAREMEKTNSSMSTKGTFNYMAPEITTSRNYDATVDIYSLGLVLYKLLNNNRLPFINPYSEQITYQERNDAIGRRLSGEPFHVPVYASPAMGYAVLKACMFDPSMRFNTASEFKQALEAVRNGTYETTPIYSGNAENGRGGFNKATVIVTCIACVCVIIMAVALVLFLGGDGCGGGETPAPSQPQSTPAPTPPQSAPDSPDDPPPSPTSREQQVRGNTTGNLANGGLAAVSNGRIYHCGTFEYEGGALFSENLDGSDLKKLSDDAAVSINVLGDHIYYAAMNYHNEDFGIISIRTDGTGRQKIYNDNVFYLTVLDDQIYFTTNDGIFVIKTDGSDRRLLSGDVGSNINIVGDFIYYSSWEAGGIFKLTTDGNTRLKIQEDAVFGMNVVDDTIFYSNTTGLYSMSIDGANHKRLANDSSGCINVVDDLIYYSNYDDDYSLYSINTDGSNQRKLTDFPVQQINIVGKRIFVNTWPDWVGLFSMDIDGNNGRFYEPPFQSQQQTQTPIQGLEQFYMDVNNTNVGLQLMAHWTDGYNQGKQSVYWRDRDSTQWHILRAGGQIDTITPEFSYDGSVLIISWPRMDYSRTHYLYADGTGYFDNSPDGGVENFIWEVSVR